MSVTSSRKTRESIFRDLVALHQSISGDKTSVASDVSSAVTADALSSPVPESVSGDVDEARASLFIEHFPMGVLMARVVRDRYRHPVEYRVCGVNRRYADLIGMARVSVLETPFFDVVPGGRADWGAALDSVVLKGRPAQGVSQATRVDRLLRVLFFLPNRDTVAVVIDEAGPDRGGLRESAHAHFQQSERLLQSSSLLICRFLPGGKLIYANDAYQRFFGGAADALAGPSFMKSIPPDEVDFVRSRVELICRDQPLVTYEASFELPEGRRWVQWSEEGVFDADGKLVAYQAAGVDITGPRLQIQEADRVGGMLRDLLDVQVRRNRERDEAQTETTRTRQSLVDENRRLKRDVKRLEEQAISGSLLVCNRCSRIHDTEGHWMLPHVFLDLHTAATVGTQVCPYCRSKAERELSKK